VLLRFDGPRAPGRHPLCLIGRAVIDRAALYYSLRMTGRASA